MNLQVLLSTYGQTDYHLLKKMNIGSDTLVINQGADFSCTNMEWEGFDIQWYNFPEKGIGLSRNTALQRASGDICLLADDDIVYVDGYRELILKEFEKYPEYDIIVFNLISTNLQRPESINKRPHKVYIFNCLRYGAFRIAIRMKTFRRSRISVSQMFGGGSMFGSGEDSLLLVDCLRNKMKIYASDKIIGTVNHEHSTWFSGYGYKYFYDKGALFAAMSPWYGYLLCIQFCIRHPEMRTEFSLFSTIRIMLHGARDYKRLR